MHKAKNANEVYPNNPRHDPQDLYNLRLDTYARQCLHDEQNHYPLAEQTSQQYIQAQVMQKGICKDDQEGTMYSKSKFQQSKSLFM